MMRLPRPLRGAIALALAGIGVILLATLPAAAQSDLDGHGPDAWRVTGVAPEDVLNARMGPGTSYPIIEHFDHDERGLQQITCVPFYTIVHYQAMSAAELAALPPRWCLMRHADLLRAGWVAQRFLTPDDTVEMSETAPRSVEAASGGDLIADAEQLVRELYAAQALAEAGRGPDLSVPSAADRYFHADIVAALAAGGFGAHPLYGAQDFDGTITRIGRDPDQPMLRGMITINVDFTNFGQPQRAVFLVRADTSRPGAPFRIFRVEHEGWAYP